jgi:hypothetical protein
MMVNMIKSENTDGRTLSNEEDDDNQRESEGVKSSPTACQSVNFDMLFCPQA